MLILEDYRNESFDIFEAIRRMLGEAVGNSWYTDSLNTWITVTQAWGQKTVDTGKQTARQFGESVEEIKKKYAEMLEALRAGTDDAVGNSWFTDGMARMAGAVSGMATSLTGSIPVVESAFSGLTAPAFDVAQLSNVNINSLAPDVNIGMGGVTDGIGGLNQAVGGILKYLKSGQMVDYNQMRMMLGGLERQVVV